MKSFSAIVLLLAANVGLALTNTPTNTPSNTPVPGQTRTPVPTATRAPTLTPSDTPTPRPIRVLEGNRAAILFVGQTAPAFAAPIGCLYIDQVAGNLYINTTGASDGWSIFTRTP